ncbi:50S ribosomal protein L22 [Candidatus Bathyarchaeota archaeon]|nr:50S ribosomal protein L22 [Candidatus Bathyarchaeota archaeon]
MPTFGYSIVGLDKDKSAIASKRDAPVSPKKTREVCHAIKGMQLQRAKEYLDRVLNFKQPVPFKRHNKHQAHRKGKGFGPGRFPIKSVSKVLELLNEVENNAEYKGLDIDKCRIVHIAVNKGRRYKKYIPRAFGRSSPYYETRSHIEVAIVEE